MVQTLAEKLEALQEQLSVAEIALYGFVRGEDFIQRSLVVNGLRIEQSELRMGAAVEARDAEEVDSERYKLRHDEVSWMSGEVSRLCHERLALFNRLPDKIPAGSPAPPPVAPLPYLQFAKSCAEPFDPERRVLEFPHGYINMENVLRTAATRVFVRECYPCLYDAMVTKSKLDTPADPVPVYILGTPGCGKTLFRMYVCHRLLQRARDDKWKRAAFILFQKAKMGNQGTTYVVCLDEHGETNALMFHEMDRLKSYVHRWEEHKALVVSLIDVSDGRFQEFAVDTAHKWFFSSPEPALVNNVDRTKTAFADLYMPLWSLDELKTAASTMRLAITEVIDPRLPYRDPVGVDPTARIEYRFGQFGGSARAVLENPALSEKFVVRELMEAKWRRGLLATLEATEEQLASWASHSLFHVDADTNFNPVYRWASRVILARIASAAVAVIDLQTLELMVCENAPATKVEAVEELWFQRALGCDSAP